MKEDFVIDIDEDSYAPIRIRPALEYGRHLPGRPVVFTSLQQHNGNSLHFTIAQAAHMIQALTAAILEWEHGHSAFDAKKS